VIPDIFCLLLTGLPWRAALNSLSTLVPLGLAGPGTFGACPPTSPPACAALPVGPRPDPFTTGTMETEEVRPRSRLWNTGRGPEVR